MDRDRIRNVELISQRFWASIDMSGLCWLWTYKADKGGYGYTSITYDGRWIRVAAHRLAYLLARGHLSDDVWILHGCPGGGNPSCCNPYHLREGTAKENAEDRDSVGKGCKIAAWRIEHRELEPRGIYKINAKLTDSAVRELRVLRIQGWTLRQLGERYGVSTSAIWMVTQGRSWNHIE